jgi:ABC-type transporter Mla subunit MlaD
MTVDPVLPQQRSKPRLWVSLMIVSLGALILAGLLLGKLSRRPSLKLATCFQDVNGLRSGAKVRLAGVEIGEVRDVQARPTDKNCQALVDMELRAPYELRIPADSIASIETAGIFGETYVEIDATHASAPQIRRGDRLPSRESAKFTAATVDRALRAVELTKQLLDQEKQAPNPRSNSRPAPPPAVRPLPN